MLILAAAAAWAARVQVDIDTTRLSVGQTVGFTVTVVDGVSTAVPQVEAPDGLTVRYLNAVQGTSAINGHVTRYRQYNYELTGDKKGDYKLGPFRAEVGAQTLTSPARSILVGPPPEPHLGGAIEGFQRPSATDLWEGQVVVWQYRVESRERWIRSPTWEPARSPALVPVKQGAEERNNFTIGAPDGNILVDEGFVAYRAVDVGVFEIGPALIRVDIAEKGGRSMFGLPPGMDPFAKYRPQIFSTEPVTLTIRGLPPPPPTFTGLVGDFEVTQELSSQHLGVDGTADWKVSIAGDGSLESFAFPSGAAPDGVRFYEQSPSTAAVLRDGKYHSEGMFSRQIVATRPGVIDLPPTTVTWFSPTRGEYVSQTIDPPAIEVTGAAADVALKSFAAKEAAPEVVDGIRPPVASGAASRWRWTPFLPVIAAIPVLALLALLADAALHAWRSRPRREVVVAPITPLERLRRLPADPAARVAALDAALRDAVHRRTTETNREAMLSGLPESARDLVRGAMHALDRARYAEDRPPADLERLVTDAVRRLEVG